MSDPNMDIIDCAELCSRMRVRIEFRPAQRVAYIRHFGSYERNRGGIAKSAMLLREWAETHGVDSRTPLLGLCHDNRRITPTHFCTYDIGIPVSAEVQEDEIVSIATIPEGYYAIGKVRCKSEQMLSAWDWLCSTWREKHDRPYQQRWNYEVYPHSRNGALNPLQGVDLCLRVSD